MTALKLRAFGKSASQVFENLVLVVAELMALYEPKVQFFHLAQVECPLLLRRLQPLPGSAAAIAYVFEPRALACELLVF